MMKGVGAQTTSIILLGSTGMYVCCHSNGYSNADMAWIQFDNVLQLQSEIFKFHYSLGKGTEKKWKQKQSGTFVKIVTNL